MFYFREFLFAVFYEAMLKYLIDNTNEYAAHKISLIRPTRCGWYRFKPVTTVEIKGFLACNLNMGIIQLTDIKDYWLFNDSTNIPFFRSVFPRDKFLQIFGMLHVGKIGGSTKHEKIQPFLGIWPNLVNARSCESVAIHETHLLFRAETLLLLVFVSKVWSSKIDPYCYHS